MIKTETSQHFLQFKEKRQYLSEIQTPVPLLYNSYVHGMHVAGGGLRLRLRITLHCSTLVIHKVFQSNPGFVYTAREPIFIF